MFTITRRYPLPTGQVVASMDVDPQKGFTALCPNELPVEGGTEIISELNAQAAKASLRTASKDAHAPNAIWVASADQPQFSAVEGKNIDIRWNSHCVPGTKGFEFIDGLPSPGEYDFIAYKGIEPDMHPYGACYQDLADRQSTGLIEFLRDRGVTVIIVGGLATDYCVKLTALQLIKAGFSVVLNLAACRGIAPESTNEALITMAQAGVIIVENAAAIGNGL